MKHEAVITWAEPRGATFRSACAMVQSVFLVPRLHLTATLLAAIMLAAYIWLWRATVPTEPVPWWLIVVGLFYPSGLMLFFALMMITILPLLGRRVRLTREALFVNSSRITLHHVQRAEIIVNDYGEPTLHVNAISARGNPQQCSIVIADTVDLDALSALLDQLIDKTDG